MHYHAHIAASPILFRIRHVAIDLFNRWIANVVHGEQVPESLFDPIDEDGVAIDLGDALGKAIDHVMAKQWIKTEVTPWIYGFVCGFVEEELHNTWQGRCIDRKLDALFRPDGGLTAPSNACAETWGVHEEPTCHPYVSPPHEWTASDSPHAAYDITEWETPLTHSRPCETLIKPLEERHRKGMGNHCPTLRDYVTQQEIAHLLYACRAA